MPPGVEKRGSRYAMSARAPPAAASVDLPSWEARKPTLGCPFSARGSSTDALIEVPVGELARLRRVEREPRDRHAGTPVTAGNER